MYGAVWKFFPELFKAAKFNVLSASTASFELEDFVYIWS